MRRHYKLSKLLSSRVIKIRRTNIGRLIMLPPKRNFTQQDKTNLYRLIARLLIEDRMETEKVEKNN